MTRKTDRSLESGGAITSWFVGMLILLFAALSVALIALGTQAYRAVGARADANAEKRTAVGYALSCVHAFDASGAVRVERVTMDGQQTDVLVFSEELDGDVYETRMFQANGFLREQFTGADTPLESAQDGEIIAGLADFSVRQEGSLLAMTFSFLDGDTVTVCAALRCAGEVQP